MDFFFLKEELQGEKKITVIKLTNLKIKKRRKIYRFINVKRFFLWLNGFIIGIFKKWKRDVWNIANELEVYECEKLRPWKSTN